MKRKKKVFKLIKKVFKLLLILGIFGIVYSISFTIYENIHVNTIINQFKKRADDIPTYSETFTFTKGGNDITLTRNYHSVPRETSFEHDNRNVMNSTLDETKPASDLPDITYKGDIFVGRQSALPEIPVIHEFVTLYYGGHAAIVGEDGTLYESFGFPDDDQSIIDFIKHDGSQPSPYSGIGARNELHYSYWLSAGAGFNDYHDLYYKTHFSVLRAKDRNGNAVSDEFIDRVTDRAEKVTDDRKIYNFLFFLDMSGKYYCTDLVSRAYDYVYSDLSGNNDNLYAKSLNDDGFITSVHDLILSRDTYIALHFEVERVNDAEFIENYYYLEQIN